MNSGGLTMPKPCTKSWGDFVKTEAGGYCALCKTEVVDFTTWTEEQLIQFFRNQRGEICGRFRPDQIHLNQTTAGFWWVIFLVVILFLSQTNPSHAQKIQGAEVRRIHGKVTEKETGKVNPVPGVNVVLKKTTIGTVTDSSGNYSLEFSWPDSRIEESYPTLMFSFIGPTVERAIKSKENDIEYNFDLLSDRPSFFKRTWWRVKKIF